MQGPAWSNMSATMPMICRGVCLGILEDATSCPQSNRCIVSVKVELSCLGLLRGFRCPEAVRYWSDALARQADAKVKTHLASIPAAKVIHDFCTTVVQQVTVTSVNRSRQSIKSSHQTRPPPLQFSP